MDPQYHKQHTFSPLIPNHTSPPAQLFFYLPNSPASFSFSFSFSLPTPHTPHSFTQKPSSNRYGPLLWCATDPLRITTLLPSCSPAHQSRALLRIAVGTGRTNRPHANLSGPHPTHRHIPYSGPVFPRSGPDLPQSGSYHSTPVLRITRTELGPIAQPRSLADPTRTSSRSEPYLLQPEPCRYDQYRVSRALPKASSSRSGPCLLQFGPPLFESASGRVRSVSVQVRFATLLRPPVPGPCRLPSGVLSGVAKRIRLVTVRTPPIPIRTTLLDFNSQVNIL